MTLCSEAAAHFEAGGFRRAAHEVARGLSDAEADALSAAYDALETAHHGDGENMRCACCATEVLPGAAQPGLAGVVCALCYEDEVRRRRARRKDEAGCLA